MTVYVQMPDTLALNVNSRVRVADVFVGIGQEDRAEELGPDADAGPASPESSCRPTPLREIGQTSHPGHPARRAGPHRRIRRREPLRNGATIPLKNSSSFPTTERTLASIATVLRGGGIPNLEVIQTEVNNLLTGNAEQIRDVPRQAGHLHRPSSTSSARTSTRAIDSTNELLPIVASRNNTLDRVLTEFPPLVKYFAGLPGPGHRRRDGAGPVQQGHRRHAVGGARRSATPTCELLQRPLKQLGKAVRRTCSTRCKLIITAPVPAGQHPEGDPR